MGNPPSGPFLIAMKPSFLRREAVLRVCLMLCNSRIGGMLRQLCLGHEAQKGLPKGQPQALEHANVS